MDLTLIRRLSIAPELRRLSSSLLWGGGAILALGLGALIWPEQILVVMLISVGVVAVVFGVYEITVALVIQRRTHAWRMVFVHGLAMLGFGLMTASAPGLTLRGALAFIAPWFVVYAVWAWRGALLVWPMTLARAALVVWGTFNAGLAILVVLDPAASIFTLLFLGAEYAALFGAWQLGVGLWLRHVLRGETDAAYGAAHAQRQRPHIIAAMDYRPSAKKH